MYLGLYFIRVQCVAFKIIKIVNVTKSKQQWEENITIKMIFFSTCNMFCYFKTELMYIKYSILELKNIFNLYHNIIILNLHSDGLRSQMLLGLLSSVNISLQYNLKFDREILWIAFSAFRFQLMDLRKIEVKKWLTVHHHHLLSS